MHTSIRKLCEYPVLRFAIIAMALLLWGVQPACGDGLVLKNEVAGAYCVEERQGGPAYAFTFAYARSLAMDREVSAVPYYSTDTGIKDVQVLYCNPTLLPAQNVNGVNPLASTNPTVLTIAACVEYPPGVFQNLTFNGNQTGQCEINGSLYSDRALISIPPRTMFTVRTYVQAASAPAGYLISLGTLPMGYNDLFGTNQYRADCLPGSNNISIASMTNIPDSHGNYTFCYAPSAVLGSGQKVSFGFIGDSISVTPTTPTNQYYFQGYMAKAAGLSHPSLMMNYYGNSLGYEASNTNPHRIIATNTTHIICELGINDLQAGATFDQITNLYLALWNYWASNGVRVYQTTLIPHTSSTDGWTSITNQGSPGTPDWPSNRIAVNDWIRTCPAPLSGCIEMADVVETSRNSGFWKYDLAASNFYTVDGLHPSSYGAQLMANLLSNSIFSIATNSGDVYPPIIVSPFTGATGILGREINLSVGAEGTGPFSYQWFFDGNQIPQATASTYAITNLQLTNGGLYSVVVASDYGSATNPPGLLRVEQAGVTMSAQGVVTIEGVAGYSYVIQGTVDITKTNSWVTLGSLTLKGPSQTWVDSSLNAPGAATVNSRYYRVLLKSTGP